MKNFTIILPVYNDWESLDILLDQISKKLIQIDANFGLLIINDGSSDPCNIALNKKNFFKKIKILHLAENIGSQSAIATAIKYINSEKEIFSKNFIIMDSDGEDDSIKINEIIDYLSKNDSNIITLNRVIRKESFVFSCLYEVHLLITFLITFKYIRFGNFSFLNLKTIKKISDKKDLWLAYSATIKKFFTIDKKISSPRKKRFKGKSKMSYFNLLIHSLRIHAVYRNMIFISYLIYSFLILVYQNFNFLNNYLIIFAIIGTVHIASINFIANKKKLVNFDNCLNNIKSIDNIK